MPTIEFHTYYKSAYENFKPVLASSVQPDWWKKMKAQEIVHGRKQHSIKVCPAMQDWLTMGYYLIADRDLHVLNGKGTDDEGYIHFTVYDPKKTGFASATHPHTQFGNIFNFLGAGQGPIRDAFKMKNPWNVKTSDGYSCLYLDPFLHQNPFFSVWPGVIDTDRFNKGQDNAQLIFYPKVDHPFIISKGMPLVQIIPFRREEWNASYQHRDKKSWLETSSSVTNPEKEAYRQHVGQHKREFPDEDKFKAGPYRAFGYWDNKTKYFNDLKECPFHQKEEESSEKQLEFDFDGS